MAVVEAPDNAGAELRAPLAITVSFGLVFSTLLTLIVIPAVYMAVPSRVSEPEETLDVSDLDRLEASETSRGALS